MFDFLFRVIRTAASEDAEVKWTKLGINLHCC